MGVASAALALVLLAGCDALVPDTSPGYPQSAPTTERPAATMIAIPTTAAPSPPASTPRLAPSAIGVVPPQGLGEGDRGPQVTALEQALDARRYDVGTVDDIFDASTRHAVIAFQKIAGLPRTGRATSDVVAQIDSVQPPTPLVPGGGASRVEIDLTRQVLFLYEGDSLTRILPVSTGSGKRFCDGGFCRRAVTPAGKFAVYKRIVGWRKSDLGRLFNPLYFNEGIAIHGFPSVPTEPASHGCVRIPMAAARWFGDRVPDGTPVYVHDGKTQLTP